jgi:hypothetical protein
MVQGASIADEFPPAHLSWTRTLQGYCKKDLRPLEGPLYPQAALLTRLARAPVVAFLSTL